MTVGKDVSPIFPDVVNCMQTDDLELKKLVYLYLINYAKSQPDLAIMAVNTFVKVCADSWHGPMAALSISMMARYQLDINALSLTRAQSLDKHDADTACVSTDELKLYNITLPGLARSQSPDQGAGCPHHGLHPRRQDHRIPVRPSAALSQGRDGLQACIC